MPTASLVISQSFSGLANSKIYLGFNYDLINTDNANYLMPTGSGDTLTGSNQEFNLSTGCYWDSTAKDNVESASYDMRKFLVPLQGGFDGRNPATPSYMGSLITSTNTMGYDCSTSTTSGSLAYQRALTLMSDSDVYDINMLLTPGIINSLTGHNDIITTGIDMCESRGDCFYVFDCVELETDKISEVVEVAAAVTFQNPHRTQNSMIHKIYIPKDWTETDKHIHEPWCKNQKPSPQKERKTFREQEPDALLCHYKIKKENYWD